MALGDKPKLLIVGARGIGGSEGGVEKFAEEFCTRSQDDFDITLMCLSRIDHERFHRIKSITSPRFNVMRTDKFLYYARASKECLLGSYDVVMLLGINSAFLGAFVRLRELFGKRATVISRTGSIDYHLPKWGSTAKLFFKLSERMLIYSDVVIAVSETLKKHLQRIGINAVLIQNGISMPHKSDGLIERPQPTVIAVGRVTAQKNYRILCDAARLLPDGVTVEIIGGADASAEYERLQAYLRSENIENVEFLGPLPRPEVLQRIQTAAVFVNCSLHEGMSNSILEAVQSQIPIVVSDIDANRDLKFERHHYFDPRNAEELAGVIDGALVSPERFRPSTEGFLRWDEVVASVVGEILKAPPGPKAELRRTA